MTVDMVLSYVVSKYLMLKDKLPNKCEQVVTVKEQHYYKIKFPADAEANCGIADPDL